MSMIEKIAEAIYERIRKGARHMPPWAEQPETVKDWHIRIARVAVEAMREPTDDMIDGACQTNGCKQLNSALALAFVHGFAFTDDCIKKSPLNQMWEAMIDKALEEKT